MTRDISDDRGVVRCQERMLSGESWSRGPVILSWDDIEADLSSCHAGHNVVIHEFAHKLDMLIWSGQWHAAPARRYAARAVDEGF